MRCMFYVLAPLLASSANASLPPPPPGYVLNAQPFLTDATIKDPAKIASWFADDVKAYQSGVLVADGKSAWLVWWSSQRSHFFDETLAFSSGWKDDGGLLILDTYDTIDLSTKPPPPGDARPTVRSTFYQFGRDGLIHIVRMDKVDGFLRVPKH